MPQFPNDSAASGIWPVKKHKRAVQGQNWPPLVMPDPYFEYTTMLLKTESVSDKGNRQVVESINNANTTAVDSFTQGSYSPYWPHWSWYFDGVGDFVNVGGTFLNVSAGDFTIECFIYFPAQTNTFQRACIFGPSENTQSNGISISLNGSPQGTTGIVVSLGGGATSVVASTSIPANTWHHVAVVRVSGSLTIYLNGINVASGSAGTLLLNSAAYNIGSLQAIDSYYTDYFKGYISNLRVITSAVYTNNFTVPTTNLSNTANTILLTCRSNRLVDISSSNRFLSRASDVRVQPFSPFNLPAEYSSNIVGGSGYFEGSQDYVSAAYSSGYDVAGGNFTVECWIKITGDFAVNSSMNRVGEIANFGPATAGVGWEALVDQTNGELTFTVQGTAANTFKCQPYLLRNLWYHVAFVRSGSTNAIYVNGISQALTLNNYTGSSATSGQLTIGTGRRFGGYDHDFVGYISNFRIVKGSAIYNSDFTPPTAPVGNTTNATALFNFTNAGIIDVTGASIIAAVNQARTSSAQKKFDSTSILFASGQSSYLIPKAINYDAYAFDTGNFTIEAWIYLTENQVSIIYDARPSGTNGAYPCIYLDANNTLNYYVNGSIVITGSSLSINTWHHIAVCRSGTNTRLFVNGSQAGSTYTDSSAYLNPVDRPTIGVSGYSFTANPFIGYMENLRVTKGFARYTSNFAVPGTSFPTR